MNRRAFLTTFRNVATAAVLPFRGLARSHADGFVIPASFPSGFLFKVEGCGRIRPRSDVSSVGFSNIQIVPTPCTFHDVSWGFRDSKWYKNHVTECEGCGGV